MRDGMRAEPALMEAIWRCGETIEASGGQITVETLRSQMAVLYPAMLPKFEKELLIVHILDAAATELLRRGRAKVASRMLCDYYYDKTDMAAKRLEHLRQHPVVLPEKMKHLVEECIAIAMSTLT